MRYQNMTIPKLWQLYIENELKINKLQLDNNCIVSWICGKKEEELEK